MMPSVQPPTSQGRFRQHDDTVFSGISMLLRIEALIELLLAIAAYRHIGGNWKTFALLFLVPDLSMLGYLVNPRLGAHLYNVGHTYLVPAVLALSGLLLATPSLYLFSLIWAAHIGFDRTLGYGLKSPISFKATHLRWQ